MGTSKADKAAAKEVKGEVAAARATAASEHSIVTAADTSALAKEAAATAEAAEVFPAAKLTNTNHSAELAAAAEINAKDRTAVAVATASATAATCLAEDSLAQLLGSMALTNTASGNATDSSDEHEATPQSSRSNKAHSNAFFCTECETEWEGCPYVCKSLAMGIPRCIECMTQLKLSQLLKVMDEQPSRHEESSVIKLFGLDIGTVYGDPLSVWSIAVVSHDGESFVIEKDRKRKGDPCAPWTCVITNSDQAQPKKTYTGLFRVLNKLMNFLTAAAGNREEDLYLVTHNGVGFDLAVLLHLCDTKGVHVPDFGILDTLPLSYMNRELELPKHDLGSMFKAMFPQSASYRSKPWESWQKYAQHTSYDDACMALMCLWHLLKGGPKDPADLRCLKDVTFTPRLMQIITICSTSLHEYQSKYLHRCHNEMIDSMVQV